jgi:hypothetical protein
MSWLEGGLDCSVDAGAGLEAAPITGHMTLLFDMDIRTIDIHC